MNCHFRSQAGLHCDGRSESRDDQRRSLAREWCFNLKCDWQRGGNDDLRLDLRRDSQRDLESGSRSDMEDELRELLGRVVPDSG